MSEGCGCSSMRPVNFSEKQNAGAAAGDECPELQNWPIQLKLIGTGAPYLNDADILLAADCTAFALGDFHKDYLKGKSVAIACPKLDSDQEVYVEKIKSLIDDAKINTLSVMIMQVPCCFGLAQIAKDGAGKASRKIPVKQIVVGLEGNILSEEWI